MYHYRRVAILKRIRGSCLARPSTLAGFAAPDRDVGCARVGSFGGPRDPKGRYDTSIVRQGRRAKAQNRYLPYLQTRDSTPDFRRPKEGPDGSPHRRRRCAAAASGGPRGTHRTPRVVGVRAGQPPDPGIGVEARRHQARGSPPPRCYRGTRVRGCRGPGRKASRGSGHTNQSDAACLIRAGRDRSEIREKRVSGVEQGWRQVGGVAGGTRAVEGPFAQHEPGLAEHGRSIAADERTGGRVGRAPASSPGGGGELAQEVGQHPGVGLTARLAPVCLVRGRR